VKRAKSDAIAAAAAYERALQMDPSWGKPALALGQLAMSRSDTAAAAKHFQAVVDVDPTSAEAAQAKTLLQQIKP
jgi:predicted TPR repeat methyltransferase